MIPWEKVREQFPVTVNSVYLNSAAAGPLARTVAQAAVTYYEQMREDGDLHWDEWLGLREQVRAKVAALINADPDEIGFTTNTSSGMNLIVDALRYFGEVVSCDLEFPVTTIPWLHRGIRVNLLKSVNGVVRPADVRDAIGNRRGVISMSHVQYSNGFRSDLEALGEIEGNHFLVVNASQSAGAFDIDVKRMKVDALCATGHKWLLSGYGSGFVYMRRDMQTGTLPRGIGWLSVNDPYELKNDEVHVRRDVSARAELGCPHFAGIFALGASVAFMQSLGMKNIEARVLELNRLLTARLQEAGWRVLSPLSDEAFRSGETLLATENPARVVAALAEKKIFVTEKPEGIRVATHFFNNEDDIDQLIEGLHGCRSL